MGREPSGVVLAGFVAAGLYNILGMLLVTRAFTSFELTGLDPDAFSPTGCAVVCLWGLAYLSVARSVHLVPAVSLVFAIEKMFYGLRWVWWLSVHYPTVVAFETWSPFYYAYGLFDLLFGVFFFGVWWRYRSLGVRSS